MVKEEGLQTEESVDSLVTGDTPEMGDEAVDASQTENVSLKEQLYVKVNERLQEAFPNALREVEYAEGKRALVMGELPDWVDGTFERGIVLSDRGPFSVEGVVGDALDLEFDMFNELVEGTPSYEYESDRGFLKVETRSSKSQGPLTLRWIDLRQESNKELLSKFLTRAEQWNKDVGSKADELLEGII
jgi:hypothetical protein